MDPGVPLGSVHSCSAGQRGAMSGSVQLRVPATEPIPLRQAAHRRLARRFASHWARRKSSRCPGHAQLSIPDPSFPKGPETGRCPRLVRQSCAVLTSVLPRADSIGQCHHAFSARLRGAVQRGAHHTTGPFRRPMSSARAKSELRLAARTSLPPRAAPSAADVLRQSRVGRRIAHHCSGRSPERQCQV